MVRVLPLRVCQSNFLPIGMPRYQRRPCSVFWTGLSYSIPDSFARFFLSSASSLTRPVHSTTTGSGTHKRNDPTRRIHHQRLLSTGKTVPESSIPSRNETLSTNGTTTTTTSPNKSKVPLFHNSNKNNENENGELLYQQYIQAREKIQTIERERERTKSEKMYQAWQRASEGTPQNGEIRKEAGGRGEAPTAESSHHKKSTGVAVIRTLVREEQERKKETEDDVEYWNNRMEESLQQAAEVHNHPIALVQWGNQLLDRATQDYNYSVVTSASGGNSTQQQQDETNNDPIRSNVLKALECYNMACDLGASEGCFNQGHLLWTGWPTQSDRTMGGSESNGSGMIIPVDTHPAMEAFRKAIDLGDTDSMFFVGVQLLSDDESGNDLSRLQEGFHLVQQAAELGHAGALYYVALLHHNGHEALGISPCSPAEFRRHLNAAVDAGDSEALFLRGHAYYNGTDGYNKNFSKALDDFLAATDLGHADAAVSAGAILHQPHAGVTRDQSKAFQLYQLAGELGSQDGWRNVVACYVTGEGVPQSLEMANYIAQTMLKDDEAITID